MPSTPIDQTSQPWAMFRTHLHQLRIATIVLPVLFLSVVDALRHILWPDFWHSILGAVIIYGSTGLAVSVFAIIVFAIIERLEAERARQVLWTESLQQLTNSTSAHLELDTAIETGLEGVLRAVGADAGVVCRIYPEAWEHSAVCTRGLSHTLEIEIQRAKLADDPVAERAASTGQPVLMRDVFGDPRVREAAAREKIQDGMSVPLIANGTVNGIIAVAFRRPHAFSRDEREFLVSAGRQLGMALHNATLYEQSLHQRQILTTLLTVSEILATASESDDLARRTLPLLLEVTQGERTDIWLTGPAGLRLAYARDGFIDAFEDGETERLLREVVDTGRVHAPPLPADISDGLAEASLRARADRTVAVPVRSRDRILGALTVRSPERQPLSQETIRMLIEVGDRLGPALENNEMRLQLQHQAVLEERERISRELHDGLAQVLGYVNTQALAASKLLADGQTDRAQAEINRLLDAAREVYADVRHGILALRSGPASGDLVAGLEEYFERYQEMFGITVDFEISPEAIDLAPAGDVELQMIRIVQEALSNVRRHARASRVQIRCTAADGAIQVDVIDDGIGFDASAVQDSRWPHFGLQMMEERARAVGGSFTVSSEIGKGTRIRVRVPVPVQIPATSVT